VNDHIVMIIVLTGIGTAAWTAVRVLRPRSEAFARRIGVVKGGDEREREDRLAELATRVSELEERLDFSERVLLQERQLGEAGQGGAR
jgi:hypothetical protein